MKDSSSGEYEPTEKEVDENFVGYTDGFLALSSYRRGRPMCIAGSGRGGTTAMMRCFVDSPRVKTISDLIVEGCNLETYEFNQLRAAGHEAMLEWIIQKQEYDKEFIVKSPVFEIMLSCSEETELSWRGNNLLVVFRDPIAIAEREYLLKQQNPEKQKDPNQEEVLRRVIDYAHSSVVSCLTLQGSMGVAMVSYEKLVTSTSRVAAAINQWMGKPALDEMLVQKSVQPNNKFYLNRQTRSFIRRKLKKEL